jgi:uncharacterized membrane protein YphA (DoxX/SURF4 family)
MKTQKNDRLKIIAYWITTALGPASFVIGGVLNLMHAEQPVAMLNHLGYPLYLTNILGVWSLLGAIAIVIPGLPRVKEWAYAGFFFLLTGAAVSHTFSGDPFISDAPAQIAPPLFFLALVIASWALRPANRRLK